MPHEPVYLTDEQLAEIARLELSIQEIASSNLPSAAIDAGIAAIENDIVAIQESAPAGPPKTPCPTCNPITHCPTCRNPLGPDGHTTLDGTAYLPDDPLD